MIKKTRNERRVSGGTARARPSRRRAASSEEPSGWTFLTNHAHVLFCLAEDPEVRLRDVAERVGITERAVQRIVTDLEGEGFVTRSRVGRRNLYEVHPDKPLRHPIEAHRDVKSLLTLILRGRAPRAAR
ncbi:MarR family transcriptional regulator [Polyangium jinanense]|uniref:MarR family transcriptional regulator n=1 Tax=Polyangium jinanense TaxID=2829994 RepID=A0A9X3WZ38_9BACT|nr:MarR family transcriptional regulator [Polyangium jinanense]MDC3980717.1 MarR family transcriptional regulator [Polyangium jinanense]